MPEPMRIVTADDSYLVREGARRILEDSGDVVVSAAVGSAAELLDAVDRLRPDAVLTDIRMPADAMDGIGAAHAIRAAYPDIGVVVLSQYADEAYAFDLFRDGTAGLAYLLKDRIGDVHRLLGAAAGGGTGRLGRGPARGRGAGDPAGPAAVLAAGHTDPARARRPARDGPGAGKSRRRR